MGNIINSSSQESRPVEFNNLEQAISYKQWLVNDVPNQSTLGTIKERGPLGIGFFHKLNPHNKQSKYYYYETVEVKHKTKFLGFNGDPYYTSHQELRFNHALYNKDLHNADVAIQSFKQQIYEESKKQEALIAKKAEEAIIAKQKQEVQIAKEKKDVEHQTSLIIKEQQEANYQISQLKSIYNNYRKEYTALCKKNADLNVKINTQLQTLTNKKSEYSDKSQQLQKLKLQVKDISKELGQTSYYKEEDVLSEKLRLEQQKLVEKLESCSAQDRTKLLFNIFHDEQKISIFNIIKSIGIDIDLLAYMACKFNKTDVLEYALSKGGSLDDYFVSGDTTIETILKLDNPEHIKIMLENNSDFLCTILNAAENNNLETLSKIHQLDKNAFIKNDNIIGYTPIHFLLLGNHIEAFNHITSIEPEYLKLTTSKGESLLKVALRSANDEMLTFLLSKYENTKEEIKSLIDHDEDTLVKSFTTRSNLEVDTIAEYVLYAVEKGKDNLAFLLAIHNPKAQDVLEYIKSIQDNNLVKVFIDEVLPKYSEESFTFDSLLEHADLMELADQTVDFLGGIENLHNNVNNFD